VLIHSLHPTEQALKAVCDKAKAMVAAATVAEEEAKAFFKAEIMPLLAHQREIETQVASLKAKIDVKSREFDEYLQNKRSRL